MTDPINYGVWRYKTHHQPLGSIPARGCFTISCRVPIPADISDSEWCSVWHIREVSHDQQVCRVRNRNGIERFLGFDCEVFSKIHRTLSDTAPGDRFRFAHEPMAPGYQGTLEQWRDIWTVANEAPGEDTGWRSVIDCTGQQANIKSSRLITFEEVVPPPEVQKSCTECGATFKSKAPSSLCVYCERRLNSTREG